MTKDGMKDKISMALKDPILQMGFEVICSKLSRLEKENAELKNRNSELASQKASLERWYGEAKEIIKKFLEFVNNGVEFDSEHPQEHTDLWNELCEKAEQFISEVEK